MSQEIQIRSQTAAHDLPLVASVVVKHWPAQGGKPLRSWPRVVGAENNRLETSKVVNRRVLESIVIGTAWNWIFCNNLLNEPYGYGWAVEREKGR
jgi:hypothetical protein